MHVMEPNKDRGQPSPTVYRQHKGTSGNAWKDSIERDVFALVLAGTCGWIAMNTVPEALLLLLIAPLFWATARNRWWAGAAVAVFVMAAGWSVVPAVPVYFAGEVLPAVGVLALAMVGIVNALPWTLLWSTQGRGWRALAALVLVTIPPLGLLGWASPLNAAGLVAPPGSGWLGLALTVIILMLIVHYRRLAQALIPMTLLATAGLLALGWTPQPQESERAAGRDLNLPALPVMNARAVVERQQLLLHAVQDVTAEIWVLPESIAGEWSFAEPLWRQYQDEMKTKEQGGWVGALLYKDDQRYANGMIGLGVFEGMVYRQRFPIPWAMWRPFMKSGAEAHMGDDSVLVTAQGRIGFLVCYEQLIVAPILQTLWARPDMVLAPTNAWWAATPQIQNMQRATLKSWSRLFATPIVTALNSPFGH